jgi:hypothetical protein
MTARSASTSSRRFPANFVRPIGMLIDDQQLDLARAFHSAVDLAI